MKVVRERENVREVYAQSKRHWNAVLIIERLVCLLTCPVNITLPLGHCGIKTDRDVCT